MDTGLDRLASTPALANKLRGVRFGLLAHPASVSRELEHVAEVLARLSLSPSIVFGPEHGYGARRRT